MIFCVIEFCGMKVGTDDFQGGEEENVNDGWSGLYF